MLKKVKTILKTVKNYVRSKASFYFFSLTLLFFSSETKIIRQGILATMFSWINETQIFVSFSKFLFEDFNKWMKTGSKQVKLFHFQELEANFSVRIRLEHQIRELEYEKKKLIGDFEEQIEVLKTDKKNLEKSTAELKEELEGRDQVCYIRI